MTDFPDLKIKALVSFPSTAVGGAGIDVDKSNGQFVIDLDYEDFAPPVGGISDPTHQNALLWNSITKAYVLAPVSLIGSGGSVPEAPNDGTQYGRQSLGWTPVAGGTPSSSTPNMDGTGAAGTSAAYSRGDHVHPSDTSRAPVSHTHVASDVTDFSEAVDDRVSGLLVAGTNVTLTYNDPANTLTINAAGGGGGGTGDVVGPSGAVNNNFAAFNATTGKLIKDSGSAASSFATPSGVTTSIGASAVRYDVVQALTGPQQIQARQNVYAAPFDAQAYSGLQINGSADVSQELITSGTSTHNNFICDGWRLGRVGTWVGIGSAALNPPFAGFQSWLNVSVTTAEPAIAIGDFGSVRTRIEGYRTSRLAWGSANAQPITIAVWSAHARTGVYSIAVRNNASTRSYVTTYTQSAANVWQYNIVTIPGDITGTWEVTNLAGLDISFTFASGATFTAPSANTWVNGNFVAAPGQVNAVAATSDVFRITGLVVLPGLDAPSAAGSALIMRPYDQELVTCQRYYQKSYQMATLPGTASASSGQITFVVATNALGANTVYGTAKYHQRMRSPAVTIYSNNGAAGKISDAQGTDLAANSGLAAGVSETGFIPYNGSGATITTVLNAIQFHWVADARL